MSTTILAIRHAKPISSGYADETLRPLDREGIATQEKVTERLAEKGYIPDKIFSSPILRARQTADILAEKFSLNVEKIEALGYSFDSTALIEAFPPPQANQTIALIGHEPSLADFVNQLLGGNVLSEGLSKSGVAILTFEKEIGFGKAALIEYLKP